MLSELPSFSAVSGSRRRHRGSRARHAVGQWSRQTGSMPMETPPALGGPRPLSPPTNTSHLWGPLCLLALRCSLPFKTGSDHRTPALVRGPTTASVGKRLAAQRASRKRNQIICLMRPAKIGRTCSLLRQDAGQAGSQGQLCPGGCHNALQSGSPGHLPGELGTKENGGISDFKETMSCWGGLAPHEPLPADLQHPSSRSCSGPPLVLLGFVLTSPKFLKSPHSPTSSSLRTPFPLPKPLPPPPSLGPQLRLMPSASPQRMPCAWWLPSLTACPRPRRDPHRDPPGLCCPHHPLPLGLKLPEGYGPLGDSRVPRGTHPATPAAPTRRHYGQPPGLRCTPQLGSLVNQARSTLRP